jgi:acyl-homoserine lactone acylase PvdQ
MLKSKSLITAIMAAMLTPLNSTSAFAAAMAGPAGRSAPSPLFPKGARVSIRRDAYGVPTVTGETDEAAMYGLGWASAADRLLQMNINALSAQGRTAEFFGNSNGELQKDKKARITGAWHSAQKTAARIDAVTLGLLQAYADGVNDFVARNPDGIHNRFAALGMTPQEWSPSHSIAAWRAMTGAYSTSALNEAEDLVQFEADVEEYGEDVAIETWLDLDPGDPEAGVVQASDLTDEYMERVYRYAESMGYGDGMGTGWGYDGDDVPHFSHAFALSGDRTTTGDAVLVSDPQLPVMMPSFWYEFQVRSPTFSARGVGTPGAPGVAIGFSESVAWGVTSGSGDQADLFRLDTEGVPEGYYVLDGNTRPIDTVEEEILVAGDTTRTVEFRRSVWGPIVTDLLDDGLEHEYALRNVNWDDNGRTTIRGMFGMMQATNLDEFKAAVDDWRAPVVNLIAADGDGNVYYSVMGGIPVRATSSPLGGMVAQDGSTTESGWQDIMPHSVLPQVTNPAKGTVYSGNHRAAGEWYPLPLAYPVASGGHSHRSRRLRDLLDNDRIFSPEDVLDKVQLNCVDPSRLGIVRIGRHLDSVVDAGLSSDASTTLLALEDWYDDGGPMLTGTTEVLLASKVSIMFRSSTTGEELQDRYGGGATGMTLFLDDMDDQIARDPKFVPSDSVVTYVDQVLSGALADVPADRGEWNEQYQRDVAIQSIEYLRMFNGVRAGSGLIYTSDPLPCAQRNTIWAQPSQSYSQFVDFGGDRLSVHPLGNTEHRGDALLIEADLWVNGEFKPAPVSSDGISDSTVSFQRLIYRD